jgi:hypothetical protein
MCGEPEVNGRSWAVNYNGYRKNYYLDELFNTKTPVPDWSKTASFDGNKGNLVKLIDYSSWGYSNSTNKEKTLTFITGNGFYEIYSSSNENIPVSLENNFIVEDFYIEIEMVASYGLNDGISGIISGYSQNNFDFFTISSGSRSYILNNRCVVPFAEILISDKLKQEEYNKLAMCKKDKELFFYINDELVYRNDYISSTYSEFGVIIPAKGNVFIKNFSLYSYSDYQSTLKSTKPTELFSPIREILLSKMNYSK